MSACLGVTEDKKTRDSLEGGSWKYGPVAHNLLDLEGIEQRHELVNYNYVRGTEYCAVSARSPAR